MDVADGNCERRPFSRLFLEIPMEQRRSTYAAEVGELSVLGETMGKIRAIKRRKKFT